MNKQGDYMPPRKKKEDIKESIEESNEQRIGRELRSDLGRDLTSSPPRSDLRTESRDQRTDEIREIYKRETKSPLPTSQKESLSIIKSFLNKNIAITLRGGNKLNGKLESISQYEIIVTIAYRPVIVMKHAIDIIELTD